MLENAIEKNLEKNEKTGRIYYVPIFYTNDWQKRYITVDNQVVEQRPDISSIKKFKTWASAKSFGMRKWQSSNLKGYIIDEVICPTTD